MHTTKTRKQIITKYKDIYIKKSTISTSISTSILYVFIWAPPAVVVVAGVVHCGGGEGRQHVGDRLLVDLQTRQLHLDRHRESKVASM
jgi:hypothetical protein